MKKKELERRIADLEAQVTVLQAQVARQGTWYLPTSPQPSYYPYTWPQFTCDTHTIVTS